VPLGAGSIATPIFVGNRILAPYDKGLKLFEVSAEGKLSLLDAMTGSQFEATPVCHEGRIYIASLDGYLYCLGEG
ncbi:MAG: PQQ-binding-like beta-propeller repeat protein, partial [Verrucomicrobiales bacterium]